MRENWNMKLAHYSDVYSGLSGSTFSSDYSLASSWVMTRQALQVWIWGFSAILPLSLQILSSFVRFDGNCRLTAVYRSLVWWLFVWAVARPLFFPFSQNCLWAAPALSRLCAWWLPCCRANLWPILRSSVPSGPCSAQRHPSLPETAQFGHMSSSRKSPAGSKDVPLTITETTGLF